MRVLFTTAPLPGHLYPLVPLALALRAAGHEVVMAAPENFTEAVIETGLAAVPSAPPVSFEDYMMRDRDGNKLDLIRDPVARRKSSGRAWGRLAVRTLPGTLRIVEDWKPDLMVCEPMDYAGPLAAAKFGVPWVEPGLNFHGFAHDGGPRRPAEEELAPELAELGLTAMPEPDLFLDVCPPALSDGREPWGPTMRYQPFNGRDVRPAWLSLPREKPRVCLTLGSMLPVHGRLDFPGRMAALMTALTGLGAEVVVAVDETIAERWQPLPEGVVAAGRFPLHRALGVCDVLISHGGPGSVFSALTNGVPQLCLPQTSDQFENAELIERHGAGLRLVGDAATDEAVVEAVSRLLGEEAFRERAGAVRDEIAAMPTPAEVVAELEKLAATRTPLPAAGDIRADV